MPARPFTDLSTSGLLWLINRTTFHPRGFALSLHTDDQGNVTGWTLLAHPAGEPYSFPPEVDKEYAAHAEDTISTARLDALLGRARCCGCVGAQCCLHGEAPCCT